MIRRASLLAFAAAIAMAFAIPAIASAANWKKNGSELSSQLAWYEGTTPIAEGDTETLSASGSFNFSAGANCSDVDVSAILVGGANEAAGITEFAVNPSSCTVVGTLKSLGCTKVTSVTYNMPNGAATLAPQSNGTLAIANTFSLTYKLSGSGFCSSVSSVTISGNGAIATPDNGKSIGSLTFSGTLSSTLGASVAVSGSVAASPAGAFGVDTAHSVALDGDFDIALADCSIDARLALDPGSTGRVTALDWDGTYCPTGGFLWSQNCTVTGFDANGLPWVATDEGTKIKLSGVSVSLDYKCPNGNHGPLIFGGDLTLTPNKASAISSTTLSGTLNAGGIYVSTVGTWNWSPASVFGL